MVSYLRNQAKHSEAVALTEIERLARYFNVFFNENDCIYRLVEEKFEAELLDDETIGLTLNLENLAFKVDGKPEQWRRFPPEYQFTHSVSVQDAYKHLFRFAPDTPEHIFELECDGREVEADFWRENDRYLKSEPEGSGGGGGGGGGGTGRGAAGLGVGVGVGEAGVFDKSDFAGYCKINRMAGLAVLVSALRANTDQVKTVARRALEMAENKKTRKI